MTCIKNIFTRTLLLTTGIALLVPAHASLATETKAVSVDEIKVTSTRITESIMGKSATIITAEEIERSAGKTLPEILAIEAGINFTDFYGGASGARQRIDIRGFGETSTENTLILLNGRRLSDLDLAAVNFSAIPVDNIKQIEILRGSQGAVLYGGGSQGGAINIITKSAVVQGTHGNLKISRGSDAYQKGSFTATQGVDNYSASLFGQFVNSDGYRGKSVV